MTTTNSKNWKKIYKKARPLDLVLFKGTDPVSDLVSLAEDTRLGDGEFSHCGVIINSSILPNVPQLIKGKKYIWESTCSLEFDMFDLPVNVETGKGKLGVQIRQFDEVLKSYLSSTGAKVALCPLISNPWLKSKNKNQGPSKKSIKRICNKFHAQYGASTYNGSPISLLSTVFPCLRPIRYTLKELDVNGCVLLNTMGIDSSSSHMYKWMFCSELVGTLYRRLAIIPKSIDPENLAPTDFLGKNPDRCPCVVSVIIQAHL